MSVPSPADAQDWAQVDYVMTLTLFIMEKNEGHHFVELLVSLLKSRLLWEQSDPCTLAAVAVYADRFPRAVNGDGSVFFDTPETVLALSKDPIFWDDPYLVGMAKRRAARPNRQRAKDGEPYMDRGV
ncbi:hypothetical protein [Cribrihabitans neustonicus]|uniref:hypothetical protein n=1 Tax=Cribrihabitans neustonicus TaxID=1429085 RepID=UPI003B5A5125